MASASEEPSAHSAPAQAADTGKQERKNLPGSRRSNKRNEEDEKEGGTGSNVGSGSRNKRRDLGRAEWGRTSVHKRARNQQAQEAAKRRKLNSEEENIPVYASQFSKEEIANEEKKPKRKVAVLIGYSGSGYKGMQLRVPMENHHEKTIEGDLFKAFVAAGAISKANADDPKKSSLIRCARTDKGVHAAGNLISLKLIIEDKEILGKINQNLSPQIRIFGIERTNGSFSAYQFCDSRIYEYLIPTHAFVPPHPKSFLGKKLVELSEEANDTEEFTKRQHEVSTFWKDAEDQYIKPILEKLDLSTRSLVIQAFHDVDIKTTEYEGSVPSVNSKESIKEEFLVPKKNPGTGLGEISAMKLDSLNQEARVGHRLSLPTMECGLDMDEMPEEDKNNLLVTSSADGPFVNSESHVQNGTHLIDETLNPETAIQKQLRIEQIVKQLKAALITARKAYRIHPERLARVRSVLSRFIGSHNFHNYTVNKNFADASANRVIKLFVVHKDPIIINDTEWLSLKVHGQSFMMHQIRKMVSMAALVVRCGCHEERLRDSYMRDNISIPKAPGLGLLLERPVFDTYNERFAGQREKLDFGKYENEMEEFKQREIYERIFREEERDNQFHAFFSSIDNLKTSQLFYLSSAGIPATNRSLPKTDTAATVASININEDSSEDESLEPENG